MAGVVYNRTFNPKGPTLRVWRPPHNVRTALISAMVFVGPIADAASARQAPCTGAGTAIIVETASRRIYVCEEDKAISSARVAIGRQGLGKTKEGDEKTPVGTYNLGRPRGSEKYHVFIPVAYPTRAQKAKGYTGSAIGIHGPPRSWSDSALTGLTTLYNWTDGCIAVGYDSVIEELGRWVSRNPSARLHVR